jgi:hypothetical protein
MAGIKSFEELISGMCKKDRESLKKRLKYINGEKCYNTRCMLIICNAMIDDGNCCLEKGMELILQMNVHCDEPITPVPCSFCGRKFGRNRCSACRNDESVRYCSKECQLGAWPMHKAVCASRQYVDEK